MSNRGAQINYSLLASRRDRPDNYNERVGTVLAIEAPQNVVINSLRQTPTPNLQDTEIVKSGLLNITDGGSIRPTVNINLNAIGDLNNQTDRLFTTQYLSALIGNIIRHDINGENSKRDFRVLHWDNRGKNTFGFASQLPNVNDFQIRKHILTGMIDASLSLIPKPQSLVYEPKADNFSDAYSTNNFRDVAFRRGLHCDSDLAKNLLEISVSSIVPHQTGAVIKSNKNNPPRQNMIVMEGYDSHNPIARIITLAGSLALAQTATKLDLQKV